MMFNFKHLIFIIAMALMSGAAASQLNGTPVLNYPSGNYTTQLNLIVSGVTGASAYVWLQNSSVVQNSSSSAYATNWSINSTNSMLVYGYNGSYIGATSNEYIYILAEQIPSNETEDELQLSYSSCTDKLSGTLMLWLMVAVGVILFALGMGYSNMPFAMAGSLIVIFTALFVGACQPIVGMLFGGGGVGLFAASLLAK